MLTGVQNGLFRILDNFVKTQNLAIPSFPRRRESSLLQNKVIQVFPLRVIFFDQFQLPGPLPLFDLLLSGNGTFSSVMLLKIDQLFDIVFFTKTIKLIVFVLPNPLRQVRGYSDI